VSDTPDAQEKRKQFVDSMTQHALVLIDDQIEKYRLPDFVSNGLDVSEESKLRLQSALRNRSLLITEIENTYPAAPRAREFLVSELRKITNRDYQLWMGDTKSALIELQRRVSDALRTHLRSDGALLNASNLVTLLRGVASVQFHQPPTVDCLVGMYGSTKRRVVISLRATYIVGWAGQYTADWWQDIMVQVEVPGRFDRSSVISISPYTKLGEWVPRLMRKLRQAESWT